MLLNRGIFIESTAGLSGTLFSGALIFISDYNMDGAVGFVVNRPFGRSLNALEEFRHSQAFPLYDGGPVDKVHLFFLHKRPDLITGGAPVGERIYSGGNFQQVVTGINSKTLTEKDVKLFVGYCGWDAGELEAELAEGSWVVRSHPASKVFEI